jgi:hypothetical protein
MRKYKSYIFLGSLTFVFLCTGYCALKKSPENKDKPEITEVSSHDNKDDWEQFYRKESSLKSSGYKEGKGPLGAKKETLVDPDGKPHFYYRAITPPVSGGNPGRKENGKTIPNDDSNFIDQEKKLFDKGYKEGYGEDGDIRKTLEDQNGTVHNYYKKGIITINAKFKNIAQNKVQWSEELKDNSEKITIVFKTSFGKSFSEDVTNRTDYYFESGDKDFDGEPCTVTLNVVLKSSVKLADKPVLKFTTHC